MTTTNVLSSTSFAVGPGGQGHLPHYGTDTAGATRRIQQLTANVNLTLAAGTYWVTGASLESRSPRR
jgi:hypothetical protein